MHRNVACGHFITSRFQRSIYQVANRDLLTVSMRLSSKMSSQKNWLEPWDDSYTPHNISLFSRLHGRMQHLAMHTDTSSLILDCSIEAKPNDNNSCHVDNVIQMLSFRFRSYAAVLLLPVHLWYGSPAALRYSRVIQRDRCTVTFSRITSWPAFIANNRAAVK